MKPTVPEGQNQNPTQATEAQAPVNPIIETAPQAYQAEAGAGTSVNNMPGAEAINQPQAPVQGNPEGYGQISTPTQNSGQENMQSAQTSPNPDAQFSTPDTSYTPQQPAPQAQPSEAEVLRTMEAGNASLSDNSGNEMQPTNLNQKLESTPNPNPEPVVVGADTSSSEFPGGPKAPETQQNVAPENNKQEDISEVNLDALFKDFDPLIKGSSIKAFKLFFAYKGLSNGDPEGQRAAADALKDTLVRINNTVINVPGKNENPTEEKPAV